MAITSHLACLAVLVAIHHVWQDLANGLCTQAAIVEWQGNVGKDVGIFLFKAANFANLLQQSLVACCRIVASI